jgi:glycosyltransferase involved in cell wall biosynthesis
VIALEQNVGFAAAVNRGIREARTSMIAILNNDVDPEPDWLERLVEGAVSSGAWYATGKIRSASNPEMLDGTYDVLCRGACAWRVGHGSRDGADFSVRRSIASIAQKRGGLMRANSYEIIEQAYRTGTQSIFLFGTAALLTGIMGMLLMQNIFLSHLNAEAANIGLFIAMGASRRGIRMQYWRRGLLLCAIGIDCVTALAALTQWAIVDFHWTLGLMKIFAMGRGIDSVNSLVYPWAVHGLVCAAMAVYIMGMHIFSLKSVLKKSSVENMRGL